MNEALSSFQRGAAERLAHSAAVYSEVLPLLEPPLSRQALQELRALSLEVGRELATLLRIDGDVRLVDGGETLPVRVREIVLALATSFQLISALTSEQDLAELALVPGEVVAAELGEPSVSQWIRASTGMRPARP